VVIGDFDGICVPILPEETHPILIIYSNAVLSRTSSPHSLQAITGRHSEFAQILNAIQLRQLPPRDRPQSTRAASARSTTFHAIEDVLSGRVSEGAYHTLYYNGMYYNTPAPAGELHMPVNLS